jgi:hypothetical protein
MLNHFHQNKSENSFQWGHALGGAIELALCELDRIGALTPGAACVVAESVIENCAPEDALRDGTALYAGALEGSPRYSAANREWIKARAAGHARADAA